uniref:Phosphoinositide phospholipase C n=1 Tax=Mucochytrium quahogii TaxID=96639 RepID=A0A7S2RWD9_9STRA|mmetsp:Transcript_31095/g.49781  ORF Transcript_31095/g.49781 Transcript_31095/m.49781 type:complete len:681 (+) Transcript_31095:185-2227(+)
MGCNYSKSGKAAAEQAEKKIGLKTFKSFNARVEEEWKIGDKDGDGVLTLNEVKKIIHKLNISIPEREVKKKFQEFDVDGNKQLDFDEFTQLFSSVQSLPDVKSIFKAACANQDVMLAEELQRYLQSSSHGKCIVSTLESAKLILKYEGAQQKEIDALKDDDDDEQFLNGPSLTYMGFQRLLTDPQVNSAMDPTKHNQVYQDMTRPLSHYFLSSSHNTYLSGNQLSSESSTVAIGKALKLGVRVIELDAWDGPNNCPIVNHGHTMCKPVNFEDCLKIINEVGFTASQYPVVITIENHCSLPQQKTQGEMLKKVFGNKLYFWDGKDLGDGKVDWASGPAEWKSPEDLKGKVVIRDKPVKKKSDKKKSGRNLEKSPSTSPTSSESVSMGGDGDDEEDEDVDYVEHLGVDEQLLRLMYIKNVKLKPEVVKEDAKVKFPEPEYRSSSSLVESKMLKLTKPGFYARDISTYAQRHLVRIYPGGSRVDSSNYDPTPAWNAGCQVVALNYQTFTLPVWLNQGRFSDNGGCGYVLKPHMLLPEGCKGVGVDPWTAQPSKVAMKLVIKVISGHYLPKPLGKSAKSEVIDPYVTVQVHGCEADEAKNSTKYIDDNGFNPVWNEEFTYSIHEPDLAMVSFIVHDFDVVGKDDMIGQRVIPVSALVPGFRMVELHHENCAPQDSYIFVQISIK